MLIQADASRKGWGAVCEGISTGGQWSKEEKLLHINVLELKAVKLALLTFNKRKTLKAVHFQIDNTTALLYLVKMGGDREPNVTKIKQRRLAVSLKTLDHNYCRIPSKFFECGGKLAVSKQQGSIRMETLPKNISTSLPEDGNAQSRFVCIKAVSPTNPVLCLETRSFQSGTDALQQIWGSQFLYAFPPFCLILRALKKVSYDQTEKKLLVTPTWQF